MSSRIREIRVIAAVIGVAAVSAAVRANEVYWTGNGSNSDFGTPANWLNNTTPSGSGTDIIHFTGNVPPRTPNNNYGDYTQFSQFLFDSGAGTFDLNGNVVKMFSSTVAKIENNSTSVQTVNFNTNGQGILTESPLELDPTFGDLVINSNIFSDFNIARIDVYGNRGNTLTLNGSIGQFNNNPMSVVNRDNNVVVMNGSNSYTGGTTLNAGKLLANSTSSTGSGAVAVNSSATLGGSGTIANGANAVSVNSGGTVTAGSGSATGDSIATLTTGAQAWQGGGAYAFNIASTAGSTTTAGQTGNAGINWDRLAMTTLSINAGAGNQFIIKVIANAGLTFTTGAKFEIANITGTMTAGDFANAFVLDTSAIGLASSSFNITQSPATGIGESGTNLFLNYTGATMTSAPEPATAGLVGLAGGMVLSIRRRRVVN